MNFHLIPNLMVAGTITMLLIVSAMAQDAAPTMQRPASMPFQQGQSSSAITTQPESYDDALQPVSVGSITYITGGIGDEERAQLQSVEKDYNVRVMSSFKQGDFAGDTHIVISSKQGQPLVDVADAGPLFYAKLPDGVYKIDASCAGQSRKQDFTVRAHGASIVHFNW